MFKLHYRSPAQLMKLASRRFSATPRCPRNLDNHNYNIRRQQLIHQIQNNPKMISDANANISGNLLNWRTILLLVASSSSITMGLYLGLEIYRAANDPDDAKPRNVFLPLWVSFDWPYQRKYDFPTYLKYMDEPYYDQVEASPHFASDLHEKSVQYQVLDGLFRLAVVRDLFGIPLSLKAVDGEDLFGIWIEPKYPTVHGPQIRISKENGSLKLAWKWTIKLVHWWLSVDSFLTGIGTKLDRIELSEALAKTHERGSGRVHEVVLPSEKKVKLDVCGDRAYKVVFQGTFHVSHLLEKPCGVVSYTGVIDFNHLMICHGARIVQLDLAVGGPDGETIYKIS